MRSFFRQTAVYESQYFLYEGLTDHEQLVEAMWYILIAFACCTHQIVVYFDQRSGCALQTLAQILILKVFVLKSLKKQEICLKI